MLNCRCIPWPAGYKPLPFRKKIVTGKPRLSSRFLQDGRLEMSLIFRPTAFWMPVLVLLLHKQPARALYVRKCTGVPERYSVGRNWSRWQTSSSKFHQHCHTSHIRNGLLKASCNWRFLLIKSELKLTQQIFALQRRLVFCYRRFGTNTQPHLKRLSMDMLKYFVDQNTIRMQSLHVSASSIGHDQQQFSAHQKYDCFLTMFILHKC